MSPDRQTLSPSDEAQSAFFGLAVDLEDSTAIVSGAISGINSAIIAFERASDGVWHEVQQITGDNGWIFGGSGFGQDFDLSGDRLLVGAERDTLPDLDWDETGSAYFFTRNAAGLWEQQQVIVAEDYYREAQFGFAVRLFGETAFIGARSTHEGEYFSGSVYLVPLCSE